MSSSVDSITFTASQVQRNCTHLHRGFIIGSSNYVFSDEAGKGWFICSFCETMK